MGKPTCHDGVILTCKVSNCQLCSGRRNDVVHSVVSQNNPSKDHTLMLSAEELLGLEAVDLRLINGMQEFEEARQRVLDQLDK